jgi:hypothetical protein
VAIPRPEIGPARSSNKNLPGLAVARPDPAVPEKLEFSIGARGPR